MTVLDEDRQEIDWYCVYPSLLPNLLAYLKHAKLEFKADKRGGSGEYGDYHPRTYLTIARKDHDRLRQLMMN